MGGGSWTSKSFATYSASVGRTVDDFGKISGTYSSQQMYTATRIDPALVPKNVLRECLASDEHPHPIPVILALDVTGSMGKAAVEVAKDINVVITTLFKDKDDIEFLVMGIGDLSCDDSPIQISQFESDIRIAEQLDKIYFEYGGGGNAYESYTAAWYMGARHTKLDCWALGERGIIITMGDEQLNPYLPKRALAELTGDDLQGDIDTKNLYEEASAKYDIYHIDVNHRGYRRDENDIHSSWKNYLDDNHYKSVTLNEVTNTIIDMVRFATSDRPEAASTSTTIQTNEFGEIIW